MGSPAFLKPFSCIGLLFIITMGSGLDALLVHMVDVLEETDSKVNPSIGPIIVGSIRWFSVISISRVLNDMT